MRMWRRLSGGQRTGSSGVLAIERWRLEGRLGWIRVALHPPLRFGDDLGGDVPGAKENGEGRVADGVKILPFGEVSDGGFVEDLREVDSLFVDSTLEGIFAAEGKELLPGELGLVAAATEHGVFEPADFDSGEASAGDGGRTAMDAVVEEGFGLDEDLVALFGEAVPEVDVFGWPELLPVSSCVLNDAFAKHDGGMVEADEFVEADFFFDVCVSE